MPLSSPPGLIVATAVVVLDHVPVAGVTANVAVSPSHTVAGPVIIPTKGNGLTVMTLVAVTGPQTLLTV